MEKSDDIAPLPRTNSILTELALIEVSGGKVQRGLTRGFNPQGYSISPDGIHITFLTPKGALVGTTTNLSDLVVVSLTDARARVVASGIPRGQDIFYRVSWSPNGKLLSYVTSAGDCFIASVSGGEPRKVTEGTHPNFYGYAPLWDATGQAIYLLGTDETGQSHDLPGADALWKVSVATSRATELTRIPNKQFTGMVSPKEDERIWSPDGGQSAYLITRDNETKQVGYYKVNLTTGKSTKLFEENKIYDSDKMDVSANGQTVVYLAQDVRHPWDLWVAGRDSSKPRRLTNTNPQFGRYVMGASRLIEWRSMDGQRLRGALLLPANYEAGKKYPLVVHVYGGLMLSNLVNLFGFEFGGTMNMQLLATRGYAVLLPDTPLNYGTPMQDIAKTTLPGVDKAIELGIADPDRLGVMGTSYGGYSTLALIVQTTRFKAAISHAGMGNLIGIYGMMSGTGTSAKGGLIEGGQGRMGGTPWEYRERYIENSPIFFLDRIQTPLLIAHGTSDNTVAPFLADEVFVGLRRLGKEAVYAKYGRVSKVMLR